MATLTPIPLQDCVSRIPDGIVLALLRDHPRNICFIHGCPRICPSQNNTIDTRPLKVDVALVLREEEDPVDSSCKGPLQALKVKVGD